MQTIFKKRHLSHVMRLWYFPSFVNSLLQTRMRSHPVGLDVWFLVGPFVCFHTSYVRRAKALARLRGCAGSPEPSLVAFVISTKISWASSRCSLPHLPEHFIRRYRALCQHGRTIHMTCILLVLTVPVDWSGHSVLHLVLHPHQHCITFTYLKENISAKLSRKKHNHISQSTYSVCGKPSTVNSS